MIDAANETYQAEGGGLTVPTGGGWRRGMLAAAAVVIAALSVLLVARARRTDPVQELVAVAPRSARPVEARLSGGFPWAPYRGSMRANGAATDTEQMKLMGAAAEALDRADRDRSADAQRAAAVAMVMINHAEDAIVRLAAEAKRSPREARPWSDLAAAQYAAALAGRASLYPEALASTDRALAIDGRHAEALFNRALILERLGLRGEARTAWLRYLEVDPASQWSGEAREHLASLGAPRTAPQFESERQ